LPKPKPFDGSNVMPSPAAQTATMGPKRTTKNGPAGSVGCGDHFGGVGGLMGSGAMTTTTTKIDDDAHPPQVIIAVL
jgi:hypothetical protein